MNLVASRSTEQARQFTSIANFLEPPHTCATHAVLVSSSADARSALAPKPQPAPPAPPAAVLLAPDRHLNTAAHRAARTGDVQALAALAAAHGLAALSSRNVLGATPLHAAAQRGQLAAVRQLLAALGPSGLRARDNGGETAAFYACCEGQRAAVELLVATAGGGAAALREVNDAGETPLRVLELWSGTPLAQDATLARLRALLAPPPRLEPADDRCRSR